GLGEKIQHGVQAELVNWQEIIAIINQIQKDIQAAIAIDERLDKLLESEKRGIRGIEGRAPRPRPPGPAEASPIEPTLPGAPAGIFEQLEAGIGGPTSVGRRNLNPIPSLKNWWGNVGRTAKNLKEKIERGVGIIREVAEVEAEAVTAPEAEALTRSLFQVIAGIRLNPKESAKLTRLVQILGNRIGRIISGLGKLREPTPGGITAEEAARIAEDVQKAAEEARKAAEEFENMVKAEAERLGPVEGGELMRWLKSRMPDIRLRRAPRPDRTTIGDVTRVGSSREEANRFRRTVSALGEFQRGLRRRPRDRGK
ncbi:MAG: hypothetical protein AABX63_04515, partial [Nanoarchaeota archaeon]